MFANGAGRSVAERVVCLLHSPSVGTSGTFNEYIARMAQPGRWASNIEMVLLRLFCHVNVISFSNISTGIEMFCADTFISKHLPDVYNGHSTITLHLYHHLYLQPLTAVSPASLNCLNHFALLTPCRALCDDPVIESTDPPSPAESQPRPPMKSVESLKKRKTSTTIESPKKKKVTVQSSIESFFTKPTSSAAERQGVSKKNDH